MKKYTYLIMFLSFIIYTSLTQASQISQEKSYVTPRPFLTPESSDDDIDSPINENSHHFINQNIQNSLQKIIPKDIKIAWAETEILSHSDSDVSDPDKKKVSKKR